MIQSIYLDINSESILIRIDGDAISGDDIREILNKKFGFSMLQTNNTGIVHHCVRIPPFGEEEKKSTSIIFKNAVDLIESVLYNDPILGGKDRKWYTQKRYTLYHEAINRLLKGIRECIDTLPYTVPRNGYHSLYLKEKYNYKYIINRYTGELGLVMVDSHDLSEFGNVIDYVT